VWSVETGSQYGVLHDESLVWLHRQQISRLFLPYAFTLPESFLRFLIKYENGELPKISKNLRSSFKIVFDHDAGGLQERRGELP